ncbi:MAG: isoprenoid biosynthesis glyoxalase ElbB [Bacteroidales bacterium]|nr:isoprenoid biosynthesis glyoxalase ElbB [Bacteroidales bacterium]MCB9013146.1 isoprenoid biosynthesis glyoxalase ElbB [Bacteroidales bacterium]
MSKTKKIAVILSGCGVFDGAEIHEATLTLYAIARKGFSYEIFAPDINQHHVINHLTGKEMKEERNVLVEAARIARGNIQELSHYKAAEFDGLIFPGGFGVAKNLSDWAAKGPDSTILPGVESAILETVAAGKPLAALCIAPVLLAKILKGVKITIGDDVATTDAVTAAGANHVRATHGEIVVDKKYKTITSPCYMLNATIDQIGESADKVVGKMIEMIDEG